MNPRSYPYLRLLFPFACGLVLGAWRDEPFAGLDYALLFSGFPALFLSQAPFPYRFRWFFGAYMSLWLVFAGYYYVVQHNERYQANHFSGFIEKRHYVIGTVYEAPSKGARLKIPLRVEAIGPSPDSLSPCVGNLLLFLNTDSTKQTPKYGDRLGVAVDIQETESPKNPYAFDYQRYLHFQNIHYQGFVKQDAVRLLSKDHGYSVWKYAYVCRDRLLDILKEHFPGVEEYAVASALLVGYQQDLPDDVRSAYAQTGSMHALAVSGTHVGMLYAGLLFMLRGLRLRGRWGKWMETGIILTIIWAFTFLTGATASVLRASVMFTTYMIGNVLHRDASAWNVLAASAFVLLLFNPYFLFDAGFQLSYAAVAGMVFFYPRFYRLSPILPKWADLAWQMLLVGFAAQLGTLPLSLYYFHQFPVYFWLAGWVVVTGGAIFLWSGAALVVLDALIPICAHWLGVALYYMLWGMNKIIFFIQQLPGSVVAGIWLNAWAAVLLYLGIGFLGAFMVERKGRWMMALLAILACLGILHSVDVFNQCRQQQVVVYSVSKKRLIDFFDGDQVLTLSDTLTPKQTLFSAQSNRWASGMHSQKKFYFGSDSAFIGPNLLYDPPFLQFFEKRMVLLNDVRWVQNGQADPVPVDVLVFSNNVRIGIAETINRFPCRLVVFDASNSSKQIERWKVECEDLGIEYYDAREQGALVVTN